MRGTGLDEGIPVDVEERNACAVSADGEVECWGVRGGFPAGDEQVRHAESSHCFSGLLTVGSVVVGV